jgi:Pyruvate:ferredoxin oxidoreductase and related 2-oxoacid:ferredoxin oxidoreductases, alpha subunit
MVCMVGNRALDDPGAFGVEHNDALSVRDLGWMLIWVDTAQEMLDTTLLAYRIAEDRRVFLPIAISADGAFLTHSQTIVQVPSRAKVDKFLPRYDRGTSCSIRTIPSRWRPRPTRTGSSRSGGRTTRR